MQCRPISRAERDSAQASGALPAAKDQTCPQHGTPSPVPGSSPQKPWSRTLDTRATKLPAIFFMTLAGCH